MGDPKKQRKKWKSVQKPWDSVMLAEELGLVGTYGLRNKRELRKTRYILSRIRARARALLAQPPEVREREREVLVNLLGKYGLAHRGTDLADILALKVEDFLERRFQTVVWRKGLAKSPYEARQLIAHGHVMIGDRVVNVPGYLITMAEENKIRLRPSKG